MIDKNDVKMPQNKEDMDEILSNDDKIRQIEDLLDLVNETDNRQELRLGDDYYSKFHWFGASQSRDKKSYFSYQEEAVYDFIFNLNKSGILSDQVGMGKTIEAGMIISELASRNELRSLLIIVPNEIMAQKWEYELAQKFGINEYIRETKDGERQEYPQVKAIANYDDFCLSIYECFEEEKFNDLYVHKFVHRYKAEPGKSEPLAQVLAGYIESDIRETVKLINEGFLDSEMPGNPQVDFDGKSFSIRGTKLSREYSYDNSKAISSYLAGMANQRTENAINNSRFVNRYRTILKNELKNLYVLIGDYFTTLPREIESVADTMTNRYPFLVIPISFSEQCGDKVVLSDFLNRTLSTKFDNYKHKYFAKDAAGQIDTVCEDYRIIDFFIDVGYQTLIVDEVHDYIDVSARMERAEFHRHEKDNIFLSQEYNRYELFDDYYFIKKSSLYKKLKQLADKANRKIFLTATPIKSDMVDFYLLTLLASNKDAESYKKLSKNLDSSYPKRTEIDQIVEDVCNNLKQCIVETTAKNFCRFNGTFLSREKNPNNGKEEGRYRYPYFNNAFLKQNVNNEEAVKQYLLSHLNYMSVEEIFLELILSYNAEMKADDKSVSVSGYGIKTTVEKLNNLLAYEKGPELNLQTRVVFRAILNNSIKIRFEEDFTNKIVINGKEVEKPIKRIRELLDLEDGTRRWFKTYKKYGIRHTRHQTYNLSNCEGLVKLSKNKEERYKNLPVWPRRNGKVLYLLRDDMFFDSFLKVRRDREESAGVEVKLTDLPNYEQLSGTTEEKQKLFNDSKAIFDYINNSMSGGIGASHEPQSNLYESVDLDDSGMNEYKLALTSKLMLGSDKSLGSVKKKVLLFAEKGRKEIVEWFRYQKCEPLYDGGALDEAKSNEYRNKWQRYGVGSLSDYWHVSESTDDIEQVEGNLLVIIDPKRYEKGVDLQKADTIINFDINYDPLKMEQRIGRIDRIRPSGQAQEINIISFVPFNDMSGFVINFFANEMKMFTQWMGETTGIVSVPDEENVSKNGEEVSFESKVNKLEEFYKAIYTLCTSKADVKSQFNNLYNLVSDANLKKGKTLYFIEKAKEYSDFFGEDFHKTAADFGILQHLRDSFDEAFRNSVTPKRNGYTVIGNKDARVIRFNSTLGVFGQCASDKCQGCRNLQQCKSSGGVKRNSFKDFKAAVNKFFTAGKKAYADLYRSYIAAEETIGTGGSTFGKLQEYLADRQKAFDEACAAVNAEFAKQTAASPDEPFIMQYNDFLKIFNPVKKLYWDDIVSSYLDLILKNFYKQCDNVLNGAKLFEKFIKTFSIADFMINMEGSYDA